MGTLVPGVERRLTNQRRCAVARKCQRRRASLRRELVSAVLSTATPNRKSASPRPTKVRSNGRPAPAASRSDRIRSGFQTAHETCVHPSVQGRIDAPGGGFASMTAQVQLPPGAARISALDCIETWPRVRQHGAPSAGGDRLHRDPLASRLWCVDDQAHVLTLGLAGRGAEFSIDLQPVCKVRNGQRIGSTMSCTGTPIRQPSREMRPFVPGQPLCRPTPQPAGHCNDAAAAGLPEHDQGVALLALHGHRGIGPGPRDGVCRDVWPVASMCQAGKAVPRAASR